jgi:hypothetical protein
MELISESDIYEPSINELHQYVDNIIHINNFKNGLRCPCGSRKSHLFYDKGSFSIHIKSKSHIKWIDSLNANKHNYYIENINLREIINNQKIIIAQLEKDKNTISQQDKIIISQQYNAILNLTQQLILKENLSRNID